MEIIDKGCPLGETFWKGVASQGGKILQHQGGVGNFRQRREQFGQFGGDPGGAVFFLRKTPVSKQMMNE